MPNKIERKDFRPRHMEVFPIPVDPRTGKKADLVGIHRGKQVIGFFTAVEQENITAEMRTNRGWKYYPIPVYIKKVNEVEIEEKADYVLFNVMLDEHPKARASDKIISIAEFLDENKQKIAISRVKPQ